MRLSFVLPLIALGLAGCVEVQPAPRPTTTTYVTPGPTVMAPMPTTSATVVTRP